MEIDKIRYTAAYMQSMRNTARALERQENREEDASQEPADMDQIDFEEGDQAMMQLRQKHGKDVYQTVNRDPALAWSVKRQTYPSALRVDKSV